MSDDGGSRRQQRRQRKEEPRFDVDTAYFQVSVF